MKDTMYKLLPGVLINLSKISATVSVAPNIIEFLSTLNQLPEVYSSFAEEQYLSMHKSSVDDRRSTLEMDEARDSQGMPL